MKKVPVHTVFEYFGSMPDPRIDRTKDHKLLDIIVIAICAVICGADGWVGVEEFGKSKLDWFKQFLDLPKGVPSHDTFGRVFSRLDPEKFAECFANWIAAVASLTAGEVIAIDGKTLRRSFDTASSKGAIHMVSAWACENGLVLGQVKTDEKSNEITAIPRLLDERTTAASGAATPPRTWRSSDTSPSISSRRRRASNWAPRTSGSKLAGTMTTA